MSTLFLSSSGGLSMLSIQNPVLSLEFVTYSYLSDTSLEVSFSTKSSNPANPSDFTMRLRIIDSISGDEIYKVEGAVNSDPENLASIVARAEALEVFEEFELNLNEPGIVNAILDCDAFNASNSLGRNKETFVLDDELPPPFDADQTFKLITNLVGKPAYLVLPRLEDFQIYVCLLRVAEKLNIPLDAEIDPTLSPEQAADIEKQLTIMGMLWVGGVSFVAPLIVQLGLPIVVLLIPKVVTRWLSRVFGMSGSDLNTGDKP